MLRLSASISDYDNYFRETPLMAAYRVGAKDCVKALLDTGAQE
ncbi:ankyrin repeat domain-containing protein [Paenibacillus periandrae]